MRGGPIGDMSDVLFHERNRFGIFEARSEKIALHIYDPCLAKRTRLVLTLGLDHPIRPLPSSDPRKNLAYDIIRSYLVLDVCECSVAEGLDS